MRVCVRGVNLCGCVGRWSQCQNVSGFYTLMVSAYILCKSKIVNLKIAYQKH